MTDFVSKRTNASQSFDLKELKAILDKEAKRPIIETKRKLKLIDYPLAEEWLKRIGIDINPFLDGNDTQAVTEMGNIIKQNLAELTLSKPGLTQLFKEITHYLGKEDPLEKSDFIFVFGGKNIGRIQKAVELWKAGWAPKIWISGGHPIYQEYEPEAITFQRYAMNDNVPLDSIYIEPNSITIGGNIKASLNLMDIQHIRFQKLILVINWYAQKRAWMVTQKYTPPNSKLININAFLESSDPVYPTNWYKSEYGINIVFNEFLKMRIHDSLVVNNII